MIDNYIYFYNHQRIQLKSGVAPLTLKTPYFPTGGLFCCPYNLGQSIKDHADSMRESVNGFIGRAISETMERDSMASVAEPQGNTLEASQEFVSLPVPFDILEAVQRAADAAKEPVHDFIRRAVDTQAQGDKNALRLGIDPTTGNKTGAGG